MFCHGACELLETRFVAGAGRRRFLTREAARRYSNADARRWLAQRGLYPGLARMAFLELLVTPIAGARGGGERRRRRRRVRRRSRRSRATGSSSSARRFSPRLAWRTARGTASGGAAGRRDGRGLAATRRLGGGGEGRRGRRRVRLRGVGAAEGVGGGACSTTRRTTVGRVRTRSGRVRRMTTTTTKPVGFRSPGETRTHPRGTRTRRRGIGIGIPASSRRVREGGAPSSYRGSSDEGSRRWIRGGSSRRRTTRA